MINPLIQLAWAGYTEPTIIAKVASVVIERRWTWRRGCKTDIRALVKASCPPRGQFKSRLEAILAEVSRQKELRQRRRGNALINWSRWRPADPVSRRRAIFKFRVNAPVFTGECFSFVAVNNHRLFLVSEYQDNYRLQLVRITPDGSISAYVVHPRNYYDSKARTVSQAISCLIKCKLFKQALIKGTRFEVDVTKGTTIFYYNDGAVKEVPWQRKI